MIHGSLYVAKLPEDFQKPCKIFYNEVSAFSVSLVFNFTVPIYKNWMRSQKYYSVIFWIWFILVAKSNQHFTGKESCF